MPAIQRIAFEDFIRQTYSAGGGPATRVVSQRIGAAIAWSASSWGVSPNVLTIIGLLLNVISSILFVLMPETWHAAALCLFLYQAAYAFDCADGQLARALQLNSEFGAWLDISCDCIAVLCQGFAALILLSASGYEIGTISFAVLIMSCGKVLSLYSSKAVGGSSSATNSRPFHLGAISKKALWLIIDTPVYYLAFSLLRNDPANLLVCVAAYGCFHLAQAAYLGLRLRR